MKNVSPKVKNKNNYPKNSCGSTGFQGQAGQKVPEMTPAVVAGITDRYIELYEHITGQKFVKADSTHVLKRIEDNVNACLKTL